MCGELVIGVIVTRQPTQTVAKGASGNQLQNKIIIHEPAFPPHTKILLKTENLKIFFVSLLHPLTSGLNTSKAATMELFYYYNSSLLEQIKTCTGRLLFSR